MAVTTKRLASGQLTNGTLTSLYTVPGATKTTVSFFSFVQAGATACDLDVYVYDGTANRGIARKINLEGNTGAFYLDPLELNAADILKAQLSTTATVDYVIMGIEES